MNESAELQIGKTGKNNLITFCDLESARKAGIHPAYPAEPYEVSKLHTYISKVRL